MPSLPLVFAYSKGKGQGHTKGEKGKEKRKRKSYKVRKLLFTRNKVLKSIEYILENKKPSEIQEFDLIKAIHYYLWNRKEFIRFGKKKMIIMTVLPKLDKTSKKSFGGEMNLHPNLPITNDTTFEEY
jgi:hypothetical protein